MLEPACERLSVLGEATLSLPDEETSAGRPRDESLASVGAAGT